MFHVHFDFAGEKGNLSEFGQLIEDIETVIGVGVIKRVELIPHGPGGGNPAVSMRVASMKVVAMIAKWMTGGDPAASNDFYLHNVSQEA